MKRIKAQDEIVLVGVLKRKRDLTILRREHWYRIPVSKAPLRKFHYLAFYEPARFGRQGKCIRSYARVLRYHVGKRRDLLPNEPHHPSAGEDYVKIQIGRILHLPHPIKNMPPRRVSFGFATLKRFLTSKNILQLYRVAPTEQMVSRALRSAGIPAIPQYYVSGDKKRYRLDLTIVCRLGLIAVECDNLKAHSGIRRRMRDRDKDIFLRRHGWCVIRLTEHAIVSDIRSCVARVRRAVRKFGGLSSAAKLLEYHPRQK
jgi:hypothetical protein